MPAAACKIVVNTQHMQVTILDLVMMVSMHVRPFYAPPLDVMPPLKGLDMLWTAQRWSGARAFQPEMDTIQMHHSELALSHAQHVLMHADELKN